MALTETYFEATQAEALRFSHEASWSNAQAATPDVEKLRSGAMRHDSRTTLRSVDH